MYDVPYQVVQCTECRNSLRIRIRIRSGFRFRSVRLLLLLLLLQAPVMHHAGCFLCSSSRMKEATSTCSTERTSLSAATTSPGPSQLLTAPAEPPICSRSTACAEHPGTGTAPTTWTWLQTEPYLEARSRCILSWRRFSLASPHLHHVCTTSAAGRPLQFSHVKPRHIFSINVSDDASIE